MGSWKTWTVALLIGLVVLVAVMFTMQNIGRTVPLSLNLGFAAWQLQQPLPVPYLLWGTLGTGLLLGMGWGVWARLGTQKRVRQLQSQVARSELGHTGDDWS